MGRACGSDTPAIDATDGYIRVSVEYNGGTRELCDIAVVGGTYDSWCSRDAFSAVGFLPPLRQLREEEY